MNYHNDEWIVRGLQYHYEQILKLKPDIKIFILTLRGSQNYGIDTENSDIDTHCIYIPHDLSKEVNTTAYEVQLPNGEQTHFIDIRFFTQALWQRSLFYVEMLYAKWFIIPDQRYEKLWRKYQGLANDLVDSNRLAMAESLLFYFHAKQETLFGNFLPERAEECLKKGYDRKSLYHLIRIKLLMQLVVDGMPFEFCMDEELNQQTCFAKSGAMSLESVQWLLLTLSAEVHKMYEQINNTVSVDQEYAAFLFQFIKYLENEVLKQ